MQPADACSAVNKGRAVFCIMPCLQLDAEDDPIPRSSAIKKVGLDDRENQLVVNCHAGVACVAVDGGVDLHT